MARRSAKPVEKETSSLPSAVTPMMQQYLSIKETHKEYLLFYRMGDFYELFFEDALIAADVLDIVLTRRGKHLGEDIPMCGVPFHSYESYLNKLIRGGHKVAICEQMEPPEEAKKRGSKSVVRREVTRIITPGTLTEDALLDAKAANYLMAVAHVGKDMAIAWADISTGEFLVGATGAESLPSELSRINPKEVLLPDTLMQDNSLYESLRDYRAVLTPHVPSFFNPVKGQRRLEEYYGVSSLESFGQYGRAELAACGALVEYMELTQVGILPRLTPPRLHDKHVCMAIDVATRKNLELGLTLSGEYKGSLLSVIDRTITPQGGRLLRSYLGAPLSTPEVISQRLDSVQFFFEHSANTEKLRNVLKECPDIERALSRLYLRRGGPRDVLSIRKGLIEILHMADVLSFPSGGVHVPEGLQALVWQLGSHDTLREELLTAFNDEVPMLARDGDFIRDGYHPKLDSYRHAHEHAESSKRALQEKYRTETGVDKLKISNNNVIGYYIEVTSRHMEKMPDGFIHRQTLGNSVRYTTPELRELENSIINARSLALELELELFGALVQKIIEQAEAISLAAQAVAAIDVFSSFAVLSLTEGYTRPVVDESLVFDIKGGRHPVVEYMLKKQSDGSFITNDCILDEQRNMWLMTGPNMAGKSTFLRQNALIAILAQMGCFVPAEQAHIGIIDRLFSRVGAADDLARGRSTFMVEMVETATILHQAGRRSFVILDEIGRGTATFDGLSIAWAVAEHLHNVNGCRTLFATHYHELTHLVEKLERLACYTVRVKEWNEEVIFLHEVVEGTADRSYGIHVGKLAGLPAVVVERAKEILRIIEEGESAGAVARLAEDLPLFAAVQKEAQERASHSRLKERLAQVNPDELSPKEALDMLYALRNLALTEN